MDIKMQVINTSLLSPSDTLSQLALYSGMDVLTLFEIKEGLSKLMDENRWSIYQAWIEKHYPTKELAYLRCKEATAAMVAEFPELHRVRGYALVGLNFRTHWWCVAPDDTIVDPTAHQWALLPLQYDALPEDIEEPHGKCYECGTLLFRSKGDDTYYCAECKK